ncbi:aspartic peptidase A1 [Melampsora larici-populina 98AG31]|uniref:Aspartic peptidase A1 n=1 Tax=Melampsora larici-populina (strain 98AG31 / pathotype 3-4-7) TaxID=747676 RepID=F4REK7_MELLP|nr:aspartic peptidase A1 [Melampsora larici-populina 98AG31]EGG09114.1 aspartic peptidase A1 [Melampsora larici-populina 98AG31]
MPIDKTVLIENLRKRAKIYGPPSEESNPQRRSSLVSRQDRLAGYPESAFFAQKNSKITPPGETTAANSVGFSIEANDVGYFAEIGIGTPPTKFKLILDSGSSDTWVPLPECVNIDDSRKGCNHATLNRESSTLRLTSDNFTITYGTGKVKGVIVEETLIIGGLILTNHAFGGAKSESKEFAGKNVPFDGLMGTGRSLLANQKVLTPIEAMSNSGILPGAFIGYALGRVSDGENIGLSTFGGVDNTKFTGDLTLFPNINTKGFWEGVMSEVKVDGVTILTRRTGILDTGTTLIVAPPADAEAVHAKIPGSKSDGKGRYTIPCTTKSIVSLSFGGVSWDIKPVDLTFQPVSRNLAGRCISGISSGKIGGPRQWLVGDTFLKGVYFATDATNNQMGLAVINKGSSSP